jgi:hypothetical protein
LEFCLGADVVTETCIPANPPEFDASLVVVWTPLSFTSDVIISINPCDRFSTPDGGFFMTDGEALSGREVAALVSAYLVSLAAIFTLGVRL